jgi:two-component system chemotaxis response regulator CheB
VRAPPLIRVLVVDDSAVARRLLRHALAVDPDLELAGTAPNGRVGLALVAELRPDIVVLDLEMPVMDGFAMLTALRESHPQLPVVVFANPTERGAKETFEALALGAAAFAVKPRAAGAGRAVGDELMPLIKELGRPAPVVAGRTPVALHTTGPVEHTSISVVVIGVSTGGPRALEALVGILPSSLEVPILVVQHMPAVFTRVLAERLNARTALSVVEAEAGQRILPGVVYIAPGGRHLTIGRTERGVCTGLNSGPPENACRPAADVLFRSAAETYGAAVLGVVMTGMGRDGLGGARAVSAAGGEVVVQSPTTSVLAGMPRAVIDAGLADIIVDLGDLGAELLMRVNRGR